MSHIYEVGTHTTLHFKNRANFAEQQGEIVYSSDEFTVIKDTNKGFEGRLYLYKNGYDIGGLGGDEYMIKHYGSYEAWYEQRSSLFKRRQRKYLKDLVHTEEHIQEIVLTCNEMWGVGKWE
jgi:hypothetical protein